MRRGALFFCRAATPKSPILFNNYSVLNKKTTFLFNTAHKSVTNK